MDRQIDIDIGISVYSQIDKIDIDRMRQLQIVYSKIGRYTKAQIHR